MILYPAASHGTGSFALHIKYHRRAESPPARDARQCLRLRQSCATKIWHVLRRLLIADEVLIRLSEYLRKSASKCLPRGFPVITAYRAQIIFVYQATGRVDVRLLCWRYTSQRRWDCRYFAVASLGKIMIGHFRHRLEVWCWWPSPSTFTTRLRRAPAALLISQLPIIFGLPWYFQAFYAGTLRKWKASKLLKFRGDRRLTNFYAMGL